jgi:hypothetical protein
LHFDDKGYVLCTLFQNKNYHYLLKLPPASSSTIQFRIHRKNEQTKEHVDVWKSQPVSRGDLEKFPKWANENLPKLAAGLPRFLANGLYLRTLDQLAGNGWYAVPDYDRLMEERPSKNKFILNENTLRRIPPLRPGEAPRSLVFILEDGKGQPILSSQYAAVVVKGGWQSLRAIASSRPIALLQERQAAPWLIQLVMDVLAWFLEEVRNCGSDWPYLIIDFDALRKEAMGAAEWFLDGLAVCFDKGVQEWIQKVKDGIQRTLNDEHVDWLEIFRIDPDRFKPPSS